MRSTFLIAALLCFSTLLHAQSGWIFDDSILPEVHISIDQDSLSDLLEVEENWYSDHEYPATFVFAKGSVSDTVENIGFRIRGNTSRASAKKSFKVSFNTFEDGRQYRGLDKMNLNGEHNDPSIIRSKLSWDIFQDIGLPAPRANHVKLYINEEYFGLYINVEHIDDEFVQDRFGSDAGNLYKCLYPADLTFREDGDYKFESNGRRTYELKTNEEEDNYSDLAYLINFLENSEEDRFKKEIEDYLNVDGVLRWMAVDILTGSWDDYWYLMNNYYLYKNPFSNRFEFIPYDYDNTFGIDWVGPDWGTREINAWGHPDQPRPLTERILEVDEYKNRLHYYVNKTLETTFREDSLFASIDRLKSMTENAAEEDNYRTLDYNYSIDDYHNSFTQALEGHVEYGLKSYITTRINSAQQQLEMENITPIIRYVDSGLQRTQAGYKLTVRARVIDEDIPSVSVILTSPEEETLVLRDDGTEGDPVAGDGIFNASKVFSEENLKSVSFYIEASDSQQKSGRYPNNPEREITYQLTEKLNTIFINEFVADNENGIQDESGSYEDWIELFNATDEEINLDNYYLTDDFLEDEKWALPDTTIAPGGFLLVWADDDEEEGPLHTNFGLNNDGEQIGLFYKDILEIKVVDTLSFGPQSDDISYGRETDGSATFKFFGEPTPGMSNNSIVYVDEHPEAPEAYRLHQNYPNPFNPSTVISYQLPVSSTVKLEVYNLVGKKVATLVDARQGVGFYNVTFDASALSSGIYFYRLTTKNTSLTKKLVLLK